MEGGIIFGREEGDCRLQYPLSKCNSKPLKQGNQNDSGRTTVTDRRVKIWRIVMGAIICGRRGQEGC